MRDASPRARLLVVDDQLETLDVACRLLERAGYDIRRAQSGAQCLEQMARGAVDLVLLDVNLPDISGLDVCRRIKADASCDAFVAFWSAEQVSAESIAAGNQAGGDAYIFRPIKGPELLARIEGCLRTRRALASARANEASYRAVFEITPLPVLILDEASRAVLAANPAALVCFGYSADAFRALPSAALFDAAGYERFWSSLAPAQITVSTARRYVQRRSAGSAAEMLLACHALVWDGVRARAMFVLDGGGALAASPLHEAADGDVDGAADLLEDIARGALPSSARALGLLPLERAAPQILEALTTQYLAALERVMDERLYDVPVRSDGALRRIAERLFVLKAGPRDVASIHLNAMRRRGERAGGAGHADAGRRAVLQLMGYLLAAYRNSHVVS